MGLFKDWTPLHWINVVLVGAALILFHVHMTEESERICANDATWVESCGD